MPSPSPQLRTELYKRKTFFTLSGASGGIWLSTTVLAAVFNVDTDKYKWIGLSVAIAILFIGALQVKKIDLPLLHGLKSRKNSHPYKL